ncbi:BrnT family toxin [Cupriavidus sp. D39]|uniref:BrnT family toxin n=1 Tax=Cupriavidus sp. D39 TaxID=2997877 RepID=UPI003B63C27C
MGVTILYSWDHNKAATNLAKHGVSFEVAQLVFEDPYHLSHQDRIQNERALADARHGRRCGGAAGGPHLVTGR